MRAPSVLASLRPGRGRGVPIGRRMLAHDRTRLALTVAGVAVVVALVLFLLTVHEGAREEANAYVASRPVDVWVSRAGATNLVRSASFLPASLGRGLETLPGVARATPLLRGIATAEITGEPVTFFLLGVDPDDPATRPDRASGRASPAPGEVVVDRVLARRHGLDVGDTLRIAGEPFRVAGLSEGTNAVVTSLLFATLEDARRVLGLEDVTSHYLVRAEPGVPAAVVADTLSRRFDELSAVVADRFVAANLREIESGVLPLLGAVTAFGTLAAAAVLSLLLYGGVVERRADYAVLKAIGADQRRVAGLVLRQAALAVAAGVVAGGLLYAIAAPLFRLAVPEVAYGFAVWMGAAIGAGAAALGLVAAWLPVRRLRSIWPGEAFRP